MLMLFTISWYYANLRPTFGRRAGASSEGQIAGRLACRLTDIGLPAAQSKPDRGTQKKKKKNVNKQKKKKKIGNRSVYLNERLFATGISAKCCFPLFLSPPQHLLTVLTFCTSFLSLKCLVSISNLTMSFF